MDLILVSNTIKASTLKDITQILGTSDISLIKDLIWLQLPSGIWLISQSYFENLQVLVNSIEKQAFQFAGLFLGQQRRHFGLSFESLYFLKELIQRYIILTKKPLEKFFYGRKVVVHAEIQPSIATLETTNKIIVLSPEHMPVGIASVSFESNNADTNKLRPKLIIKPINDIGMYLRKEHQIFS